MAKPCNAVSVSLYPNIGSVRTKAYTQRSLQKAEPHISRSYHSATSGWKSRPVSHRASSTTGYLPPSTSHDGLFVTTVIQRLPRRSGKVKLDALLRSSPPVPHLFDGITDIRKFTKRPERYWEDQVKKVVPRRPNFAVTSDPGPTRLDDLEIGDNFINDTKGLFYCSNKLLTQRSYVIDPEWISEKVHLKEGPSAYRTCAIRYGWCT